MRKWESFQLNNKDEFRRKLLQYSASFNHAIFLDSCNNLVYGETTFNYLAAVGNYKQITCNSGNAFTELKKFIDENCDWVFGFFGYDLKNEIEKLSSKNLNLIDFDDLVFFIPETIAIIKENNVHIGSISHPCSAIFESINIRSNTEKSPDKLHKKISLKSRISKQEYFDTVNKVKQHILNGDIYELNYCQEFYAENCEIDPYRVFNNLCLKSQAPFSVLFRWEEKYLISASPERFLKKVGNKILSQPIKGTIERGKNKIEDEQLKDKLLLSEKDRAENVMIVDLVRNDLSKSAIPGTIQVEELFGIYSFKHVHQMISIISAEVKKDRHLIDIIKNAFPMGSMTGAPKVMAMKIIDEVENFYRGIFSGAVGYITPEMDFDFNVVIRSIIYNDDKKYISVPVGGAIVYDSIPEEEYQECMIKLTGILEVLANKNE